MQQTLNILALLACPLMMVFCLKGMFSGKKDCHHNQSSKELVDKVTVLEQQNVELIKEINDLKKVR